MIIPDPLEAKIKSFIDEGKALHGIASWLVNLEIHKHVSMDLEDLADTAVVADEIGAIVECLEQGDYQDAISMSKESAHYILEEEGFDF